MYKAGNINAVTDPQYQYCVLLPRWLHNKSPAALFGIGPQNDDMALYNTKIGFLSVAPPNGRGVADEFMFRCLCNYDRCNSQKNFDKYLVALEKDSVRRQLN
ncbi:unnamed protein product [Enterobius vermicularis]|uniref:COesterase domain-containing protein n=1 Tax=Enterobius vermicularis TaxID=51028 RepID=A0A0N4VRN1_ENTVE|nr:unnamed protein product [Enterobius vermicularis]